MYDDGRKVILLSDRVRRLMVIHCCGRDVGCVVDSSAGHLQMTVCIMYAVVYRASPAP